MKDFIIFSLAHVLGGKYEPTGSGKQGVGTKKLRAGSHWWSIQ
jgi:hypothetical protein